MGMFGNYINRMRESTDDTEDNYNEEEYYEEPEFYGSSYAVDDEDENYGEAIKRKDNSRKNGFFGGFNIKRSTGSIYPDEEEDFARSYQAAAAAEKKAPDIKTFCPNRFADVNEIFDAMIAGMIVHVKLDQILNSEMRKEEKDYVYWKIIYGISGCAYATNADVCRIDETSSDFLVIPKNVKYETELPEDFVRINREKYNISK